MTDYIDINTVCKKYLPLSRGTVAKMCVDGVFKTAYKPGNGGKTSKWVVARTEVIQHKINATVIPDL